MRKKLIAGIGLALVAGLALSGCSARGTSDSGSSSGATIKKGDLIGVALPAKTSQNWVLAGAAFKKSIEDAGFKADIQYANAGNPVPDQQSQISSMVTKGAKAVIIGAADGSQLGSQVKAAKAQGATVTAWDRNILNTKNVDYYVAFNNFKVGQLQAQALLDGLKAKKGDGPYNIELFAGSADDANATVFFNGAMDVLEPKIKDGTVKVVSGQETFQKVQTKGWLAQNAQSRMTDLLSQYYSGSTKLDGVLSPNDTLARAILTATKAAGKDTPVITGQDSETASIPLIMKGTQYSTIYKNTTEEAQAAIDLVSDLADGKTPKTVSDKNNDNGVKVVPTVELTPILVTKDNAVEAYKGNDTLEQLAKQG
ncbi:putative multiple sugar transport system substrate-binding protein [Curtobacterium luteum]|uniref:Multiple sugar transport system substrate-binding protein n=1 Tax=Curtobacterium luteum TaxID=33881 RepID=A0A8H9L293_9MICO|nr:sugar-binding protein [Curtobacterium luteum]MBM7803776.1 putative multiple sugar transport system substrate-binding protein [Curtobacterium luteum]NUU51500.1 sugar-binding protein [Curtobacterium luteum]GGL02638.1 sugar ABC transporter substrate-binding protein [Curtobacterium luteum]